MKQKLIALMLAFTLIFSLSACTTITTPSTVGTIGEVEITAGIYLISQFNAFQSATSFASTEQQEMSVSQFLKESISVPDEDAPEPAEGEEAAATTYVVADYVAKETMLALEFYAAVETKFAELGGELTTDEIIYSDAYAQQVYDQNANLYAQNGIGIESMKLYQLALTKGSLLLDLIHGENGTDPISDDELTAHLNDNMVYGAYISVPLYNQTTFAFADETQQAEIVEILNDAVKSYESAMITPEPEATAEATTTQPEESATPEENTDTETEQSTEPTPEASAEPTPETESISLPPLEVFRDALAENIVEAYAVLDVAYDVTTLDSEIGVQLFGQSTLESNFDATTVETINSLGLNEAAAFQMDILTAMAFLRLDPMESTTLDTIKDDVLFDMKAEEVSDMLTTLGSELTHSLDQSAMNTYSANNIK